MKFSGIFKGKEEKKEDKREKEREMDKLLRDTDIKLRMLYNNYKLILQREIIQAKGNQRNGIRNQDNYAKIGVAYYSMLLIYRAQERMDEMKSYHSLCSCITGLNEALTALNQINQKMGKVDVKKVASAMKKMSGSAGGSSRDLEKAYETLRKQEEKLPGKEAKNTGVENLVSVDVIEKLISGVDVEAFVRKGEGIGISPEDFAAADDIPEPSGRADLDDEEDDEMSDLDRMRDILDSMK